MLDKLLRMYNKNDVSMPSLLATTKCSEVGDLTLDEALLLCIRALQYAGDEDYIKLNKGE